jgi:hypothetical protein
MQTKPRVRRNGYGHIEVVVTGIKLTAEEEVQRLTDAGCRVSFTAKNMLGLYRGYTPWCSLEDGEKYRLAFVRADVVDEEDERTLENIVATVTRKFGYVVSPIGVAPRLREILSNELIKSMDFDFIAVPQVIGLPDGRMLGTELFVFAVLSDNDEPTLCAAQAYRCTRYYPKTAFAFLVKEKKSKRRGRKRRGR